MDIKIGFTENPRELVIAAKDNRDEIVGRISEGLRGDGGMIELTDSKDHTYFINSAQIAYVEVGSTTRPAVGFGGV